ncbi:hypothetical protein HMPREF1544_08646 [Mucor circinelloides 1006PhL]|uniref:Uncharacterized protein n=1 Tax=Mucor circinelloides f. circinelloides (strain 1006PhL) TaxID=1220926 RepID=S2J4Q4_MUCC1|nr:hypothetical protein HMPREF1544_08646 [Mucor circinelloides 1006PhL]
MTAGLRWRGNGEISAALFKRVINHKAQQRIIPAIKHPVIGIPCEESSQYYNKGFNASIKIYTPPLPLTPAILNSSPNRRRLSRWWTKFFSLQQLRSLMGYHCHNHSKLTTTDIPSPVKIIAYADGTLVTLSQPEDFHQLQAIQARYINAFNAKLTYDKTQVLLLSGALPVTSLPPSNHSIQHWHDLTSQDPLMYLWYAIIVSHSAQ